MRIAALGRTRMLWNTIHSLASAGHQISLIATCKSAPEYTIKEDDFKLLAAKLGAQFLMTQNLNRPEIIAELRRVQAEVAVSVNWVNIIGAEACGCFPLGILNAHAGDLPRYRGNAPVAWAILQGEDRVGITIHQMDPQELDAGPIILKDYFPLTDSTYIGEVFEYLERRIPELFTEAAAGLAQNRFKLQPQPSNPSLVLRCYPRRPEDGLIRCEESANVLARLVRASAEPFAGAFTFFQGKPLIVWRARAKTWPSPSLAIPGQVVWRDQQNGEVGIATGNGILVLEETETSEHGRCRPATIIKSLRDRLGATGIEGLSVVKI